MTLRLNGKPIELPEDSTVASLLKHLNLANSPCAVEVNQALIPKAKHVHTELKQGDAVEVVTLVGGG